jgi:hypothetical protein
VEPSICRLRSVSRRGVCFAFVLLSSAALSGVAYGHVHYGNLDAAAWPATVRAGEPVTVIFSYRVSHSHTPDRQPWPNPWEVRLDGAPNARNGILLASGVEYHPAAGETPTFRVATTITIPLQTAPGSHVLKVITTVDPSWPPQSTYTAYSYIDVEVGVLRVDAGPDQTVEQGHTCGAEVALAGMPRSPDGLLAYEWRDGNGVLGTDPAITAVMQLGVHTVAFTVTDRYGQSAWDDCTVTVRDTRPPVFKLDVLKETLWPPNHQMVLAAAVTDVSDACDADPVVTINVTSNQPISASGAGNTDTDWEVVRNGDVWEIWLRAERAGPGSPREYVIQVLASDASGNTAEASATITVPHDKGKGGK